jgi:hypothetical protein
VDHIIPDPAADMPQDNNNTPQASYFFGINQSGASYWETGSQLSGLRFTIYGTTVPEPSTLILAALGALAMLAYRRGR